jgi:diguanylate cyclase (GGDEF)-like protein
MKAHTSWTLWQIMNSKQSSFSRPMGFQRLLRVLHIVENPRTAFWFFRSLHKQAEAQCSLTSISSIQQAADQLHHQHYDAVFIHVGAKLAGHLADIALLKHWGKQATLIAILHDTDEYSDPQPLDAFIEAGIDDYIKAEDINTPLLPRLVSYAVERKQANQRLAAVTQQDSTTGLANRAEFLRLCEAQLNSQYGTARSTAILLIDLDQFKNINDSQGHSAGDKFLHQVAARLKRSIRQSDTIARLGGDEFVVMLPDMPDIESIQRIAQNLLNVLSQASTIDGRHLCTTASIGISMLSNKSESCELLLKNADIAMYSAKQQGGNRFAFFTRNLQVAASLRISLETELNRAIANDDFFLTYQPQINVQTGELYGAEVLLRWNHAEHGEVPPNAFIPTLESTGLIGPVTDWIIRKAIAQWQQWTENGALDATQHLSINLSPKTLGHPDFKATLLDLKALPVDQKQRIHFEITENLFVDPENNIQNLRFIKECGFQLSMDDFGTGYSCLSYLKHFPLDCIKLDCEFTRDIINNPIDLAITQAVINLSKDLHIDLIAEGVENEETLSLLKTMGCTLIQGYYFSKPLTTDDFQGFCQNLK